MNFHPDVGKAAPDRAALLNHAAINGLGGHTDEGTSKAAPVAKQDHRKRHRASRHVIAAMRDTLTAHLDRVQARVLKARTREAAVDLMVNAHVPPIARAVAMDRVKSYAGLVDVYAGLLAAELELLVLNHVPAETYFRWMRLASAHCRAAKKALAAHQR
jgi:hypothetical protein